MRIVIYSETHGSTPISEFVQDGVTTVEVRIDELITEVSHRIVADYRVMVYVPATLAIRSVVSRETITIINLAPKATTL